VNRLSFYLILILIVITPLFSQSIFEAVWDNDLDRVKNQYGDCEGVMLRSGNAHNADRWKELLEPMIQQYENKKVRKE